MKIVATFLLGFGLVLGLWSAVDAQGDKAKEVTLKGRITCPKCDLGESDKCGTLIVVKEKDKKVHYYFDAESNKKYHKEICNEGKNGTVVGTVKVDGKKNIISVKKVEFE